jgi:hypothetical protein
VKRMRRLMLFVANRSYLSCIILFSGDADRRNFVWRAMPSLFISYSAESDLKVKHDCGLTRRVVAGD